MRNLTNGINYIGIFDELDKGYKYNNVGDIIKLSFLHYYHKYCDNMATYKIAPMADNHSISVRKVLNYRMAELLGIEDMVQESKLVRYTDSEGQDKKAVLTEVLTGPSIVKKKHTISCSKELKQQLNALEVFDFITGQLNRYLKEVTLNSINDNDKIKSCNSAMSFGTHDYKSMIKARGCKLNLGIAGIKESLANRILAISDEAITLMFMDFLDKEEIKALTSRIHGVQKWLKDNPQVIDKKQKRIAEGALQPAVIDANELPQNSYLQLLADWEY